MVTLGEFIGLIDNFYSDAAIIKVFDSDKVVPESDSLRDDIIGFVFSFGVGEDENFLNPRYLNAEIKEIYICKKRVIKVLVDISSNEEVENVNNVDEPLKRHGFWRQISALGRSDNLFECSCCGYPYEISNGVESNYCPNCGSENEKEEI